MSHNWNSKSSRGDSIKEIRDNLKELRDKRRTENTRYNLGLFQLNSTLIADRLFQTSKKKQVYFGPMSLNTDQYRSILFFAHSRLEITRFVDVANGSGRQQCWK